MKIYKEVFQLGNTEYSIETGGIARQATGSVLVSAGDTVVLVTAVAKKEVKDGADFFPLTVNYQEKSYAAGKIPGGFPRREGRPGEAETLTARLIDRPLRPLFPEGFYNEVQVVATVLSFDPEVPPDIPALIGASASLVLSGVPFEGPIAGVRVGFIDGQYVLNPSLDAQKKSELDLVVAGTSDAVLMVESEAESLPEEVMLGAVLYGHKEMQVIIDAINHLAEYAAKPRWDYEPKKENKALKEQIKSKFFSKIKSAYEETEKQKRNACINTLRQEVIEAIVADENEAEEVSVDEIKDVFHSIEKDLVRKNILAGSPRIDGRDTRTVRPISVRTGVIPKAHGSALFTRGETQALVVTTLGNDRDAQLIENLNGDLKNRYMLHYNFPPYSVGETGMMGTPKRREIGHANLAKRATQAVFPNEAVYPYVVRVVSEITESNGSSSMATVCGSSLSMMDAGVPLAAPVAGIAMGLIKEGDKFAVLSDILGDEDHLGDMDFKVAGTQYGVTALQMDIKIKGITREIMQAALDQAKEGRLHILGIMNEVISEYKTETSAHAPQVEVISIDPSKIRDVIGKGGATVKGITEKTGASIDTSDNGDVKIFAKSKASLEAAIAEVEALTASAEVGQTYTGKVVKVLDFGAFVNILPGKDGLLPFSELESLGINPNTLAEGKSLKVMVQNVDRMGKIKLVPLQ
ncbi:polyribonucleotide nucleotidyltransferase [Fangia hongkongensis]|uniref:polyribonucleotide nucleotidyltransferase n=1 Tax=Fangia hongkongensis TaxID=270495 RepID=UPI0003613ECE|nr:polyribonucleotide nucleotidyltransferase [Fangia hongkongensis]MBK2124732.1 polyribonucleotide nucleotidyltransferase [Fangia hongkongensis]